MLSFMTVMTLLASISSLSTCTKPGGLIFSQAAWAMAPPAVPAATAAIIATRITPLLPAGRVFSVIPRLPHINIFAGGIEEPGGRLRRGFAAFGMPRRNGGIGPLRRELTCPGRE